MLGILVKQPTDQLDYDLDLSKWMPDGDEILSVTHSVEPAGSLVVDTLHVKDLDVKVWLSGGEDGKTYVVSILVGTREGRVKEASFKIRVRNC